MRNEESLELRWFLAVIRRRAWLIVACILAALLIAFAVTGRIPPAFEATTTLLVLPSGQISTSDYTTLMAGERLALTYGQMLKEPSTLQTAISTLGLPETPETLAKRIKTEPVRDTQLIRVTVTDSSAERAALIANTVADTFTAYAKTLQQDRYKDDLLSKQGTIESQRQAIADIQAQIDTLNGNRISNETELARLQELLTEHQTRHRTLQADLKSLQLQVERIKSGVKIVEIARAPEAEAWIPFSATVTLLVDQNKVDLGADGANVVSGDRLARTYAQMVVRPSVLEAAVASLGTGENLVMLADRVTAEPIAGTQLLRLQVAGVDAPQSVSLANAIAQAFVDQMHQVLEAPYISRMVDMQVEIDSLAASINDTQAEIQKRTSASVQDQRESTRLQDLLTVYQSDYQTLQRDYEQLRLSASRAADTIVTSERAHIPAEPVRRREIHILLAGVVVAMLATGAAFLLDYLHDTVQTPEDVSRIMGLTTIGSISRYAKGHEELIEATRPNSQPAEAYRVLATNLCFALADASLHTVVVTSALGSEGKSETAANLAVAMTRTGYRVIVVDGDLRRPRLHLLFGLPQGNGLGESLLLGQLDANLQQTGIHGLQVLTSGVLASDPIQLISSSRMDQLLAKLARTADFVIIDSPPVLGIADTAILASKADAVLLVVRANRTSRQAVQHASETLRRATSRLVRVVLNGVPERQSSYYGYYGYKSGSRESVKQPQAGLGSSPPPQNAPPVKQGQPAGGRAAIQKR